MSVQSRVPTDIFNNMFKSQNKPKFHVEELSNQESRLRNASANSQELENKNFRIEVCH